MPKEPFKYIFGPVPSRRLGKSLGIDLIPFKTCCLNCLYCECGKTTVHTLERKEYIPARAIIREIDVFLSGAPSLDVITFAGGGEPALNTALPELSRHIQTRYPQYKTALLTNGSLFHLEEVRQSSLAFDFVLPSLDAVRQQTFEKINQPAGVPRTAAPDRPVARPAARRDYFPKSRGWAANHHQPPGNRLFSGHPQKAAHDHRGSGGHPG